MTIEDQIIPGMSDGANCGITIPEPTVKAAIEALAGRPGYLGFQFAKALTAKVTLDDGTEEITFTRTKNDQTVYKFAKGILSVEEFAASAALKPAYEFVTKHSPYLLDNKALIFEVENASSHPMDHVKFLLDYEQENTVLISKQGQQLWPTRKL